MPTTTRAEFDPVDWSEFYGQSTLKHRLDVACRSAQSREVRLDHILFDGPGGSGKSTMANLLAQRMCEPYRVLAEPLGVRQMMNELYDHELGGLLFVDEIHAWPKATLNALLPFLEGGWFGGQWFPFTTIAAATTDMRALTKPFISRFIVGEYEDYTLADMTRVVERFAQCADVEISGRAARALAEAAGGMPRTARSFVIAARDLAVDGKVPPVKTILKFCNHYSDGLSTAHLAYLRVLAENRGRAGLSTLASRLRKHPSIVQDLEAVLLDRKMIFLASDGRTMTAAGRARLQEAA